MVEVNKDLGSIRDFYDAHGYVKAQVSAKPQFNDSAATVLFAIHADEGNEYRMGTLEIEGVEKSATAHLLEAWKLHAGEPYDKTYLKKYLASLDTIFPRMDQMRVDVDETPDESTQTMDVLLRFIPK